MAHNPFFSLVVPTRNRPDLARVTVRQLLTQTHGDFEILVLENSDEPCLSELEHLDSRVRVLTSSRTLSMPDNWERGLDAFRGKYVIYLSDKDRVAPRALEELLQVIERFNQPAIVNTRRSVWYPERGLLMERGGGAVAELPSRRALDYWFSSATNLMNAPMIYNSVVRRDRIVSIRERCNGRFFFGNSPDVGSGVMLLADNETYVVLDRLHIMAVMGPWSIGWATITKGRRGAAEHFAAEFRGNPLTARGLVWSLTGVVVETLMSCQDADRRLLGSHAINWVAYCTRCMGELAQRSADGQDVSEDLAALRAGVGPLYPKSVWVRALAERRYGPFVRTMTGMLRHRTPTKVLFPPYDGWRRRFGLKPNTGSPGTGFKDEECFRPLVPIGTPDAAFAHLLEDQGYGRQL